MIPAMIASFRHFLGWLVSGFRSREDPSLKTWLRFLLRFSFECKPSIPTISDCSSLTPPRVLVFSGTDLPKSRIVGNPEVIQKRRSAEMKAQATFGKTSFPRGARNDFRLARHSGATTENVTKSPAVCARLFRGGDARDLRRLFVSQGNHGIDTHGPPRGNMTGHESNGE